MPARVGCRQSPGAPLEAVSVRRILHPQRKAPSVRDLKGLPQPAARASISRCPAPPLARSANRERSPLQEPGQTPGFPKKSGPLPDCPPRDRVPPRPPLLERLPTSPSPPPANPTHRIEGTDPSHLGLLKPQDWQTWTLFFETEIMAGFYPRQMTGEPLRFIAGP